MLNAVLERHRIGKKSERREIVLEFLREARTLLETSETEAYFSGTLEADLREAYKRLRDASTLYYDLLYGHDSKIDKEFNETYNYIARNL